MRKAASRAALAFLFALVALVGLASPASAHAELLFTTPEEGAVLETVPAEVNLTFSESVLPESVVISVEDETGFVVRVLDLRVEGADVFATWPPGMRGTDYSVNYRVVSEDGHPVEGALHFSVTTPPTDGLAPATTAGSPSASAVPSPVGAAGAEAEGGGTSLLIPVLAGLAVGIVVGLAIYAVSRRRTGPEDLDGNSMP